MAAPPCDGSLNTNFLPLMKRRMAKSTEHFMLILPMPCAQPSKTKKVNGAPLKSSDCSISVHSWHATSGPPARTTRPKTTGISPSCCARPPASVRSSTPATLKSSKGLTGNIRILFLVPVTVPRWRDFLCPSVNRLIVSRNVGCHVRTIREYRGFRVPLYFVLSSFMLAFFVHKVFVLPVIPPDRNLNGRRRNLTDCFSR